MGSLGGQDLDRARDEREEEGSGLEEQLEHEELRLGSTPHTTAVAEALLTLHKTCRSFVLYDSKNDAIRKFLGLVREKFSAALLSFGEMVLDVRPFELVLGAEVVYLERDRERSLAFRLYRDGVRRITIAPAVDWDEMLRFLEVLSLRTVGASLAEEDAVTMLHKAGLQNIHIDAIEGYVPDEEMPEIEGGRPTNIVHNHVEAPRDWDQPFPGFEAPALVQYRPIPDRLLTALRAEEGPGTLMGLVLRLLDEMVDVALDPTDPTTMAEVLPYAREARDYLLIEGDPAFLAQLFVILTRIPSKGDKPTPIELFGEPGVLERSLEALVKHGGEPKLERALFPPFRDRVLTWLLDRLEQETWPATQQLLLTLLRPLAPSAPDMVLTRLTIAKPTTVDLLIPILQSELRERAYPAAMELLTRDEPAMQRTGFRLLDGLPLGSAVGALLVPLLASADKDVRAEAAGLLCRSRDPETFQRLVAQVKDRGGRSFDHAEAEVVAHTLGRMNPEAARDLFHEWLKPAGLLERLTASGGVRFTAAVGAYGLAAFGDLSGEVTLRNALNRADDDLRRVLLAALARRRQREGRHG